MGLLSRNRQSLLLEFASLKASCPAGIYIAITPNDPSLWSGILFVRIGPYAPSILRFQILFPPTYPTHPPLITFSTDLFHPLCTPLTTYTHTTSLSAPGGGPDNTSASIQRLPPGGFSLEHGFPGWFGAGSGGTRRPGSVPITHVLAYVKFTIESEDAIDAIPLVGAANPSAWHAWKARRSAQRGQTATPRTSLSPRNSLDGKAGTRKPGEWNWEGVWEERVKKSVANSLAESTLFGIGAHTSDDLVRFLDLDEEGLEEVRRRLIK